MNYDKIMAILGEKDDIKELDDLLDPAYVEVKEYFTDPIMKVLAKKQTNMEFLVMVKACIRMPKKLERC